LHKKQFASLIALIQPKFRDIKLALSALGWWQGAP
jgi:hypothetical protein